MPPRKGKKATKATKASKKREPSPMEVDDAQPVVEQEASSSSAAPKTVAKAATEFVETMNDGGPSEEKVASQHTDAQPHGSSIKEVAKDVASAAAAFVETMTEGAPAPPKPTMEERNAKLEALRARMGESARANRKDVIEEASRHRTSVRDAARLEKQRKLAETLRLKADAEERGEDVERAKNWEYSIEENDEWEKRLARKNRRSDFQYHDDEQTARRKYKKDLDLLKPDLEAYNRQKETAMGLAAGTLTHSGVTSAGDMQLDTPSAYQQQLAAENLYRDANTMLYADNKPSEDAIDRVVAKINKDMDKRHKFSRKRTAEDAGEITYINERNRVFNKKIARYYDKYTEEIRASFERGTAL